MENILLLSFQIQHYLVGLALAGGELLQEGVLTCKLTALDHFDICGELEHDLPDKPLNDLLLGG